MHTIGVDFDVYKQLAVRRATEEVAYNDVIREQTLRAELSKSLLASRSVHHTLD